MREENRSEIIHDALQFLDDEMIEDVEKLRGFVEKEEHEHGSNNENQMFSVKKAKNHKTGRNKNLGKWTALAASICILIAGSWIYETYLQPTENLEEMQNFTNTLETESKADANQKQENAEADDHEQRKDIALYELPAGSQTENANEEALRAGVTIPPMQVNLKKTEGIEEDMLGFFILNGCSYIQYEFQHDYNEKNADFVGEYVGHINGLLNEWTKEDGYVEGAGTYTGDVYEVKGVRPEFMLCMVWDDGSVETFIHHNDITLFQGSDLIDEWLDLRENYKAIALEAITDNQWSYETLKLTEEEIEAFDRFLDAFAEGNFVYVEEKLEYPFGGDKDTPDMMDFYFEKENGVRLRFRTLGDGYVSFPWIHACVQIKQEVYDEVVSILHQHTGK